MNTRDQGQPEFNPKHRLAGAVIIVVLGVVLIPMVLDERELSVKHGRGHKDPDTKVVVTKVDELKRRNTLSTLPDRPPVVAPPAPKAKSDAEPKPSGKAESAETARPAPPPAAKKPAAEVKRAEPKKAATPRPSKPPPALAAKGGWVVQVGTFSKRENAHRIRDKLKRLGYSVHLEDIAIKQGRAVRVRVGPFDSRRKAMDMQARIEKDIGLHGMVLNR